MYLDKRWVTCTYLRAVWFGSLCPIPIHLELRLMCVRPKRTRTYSCALCVTLLELAVSGTVRMSFSVHSQTHHATDLCKNAPTTIEEVAVAMFHLWELPSLPYWNQHLRLHFTLCIICIIHCSSTYIYNYTYTWWVVFQTVEALVFMVLIDIPSTSMLKCNSTSHYCYHSWSLTKL